jgi:hypothetical protein
MSVSFFLAPKTHQIKRYGRTWEIQDETYTCGPVAVINALHYFGRCVGTATRRSINRVLNTLPIHIDGFKGTRPDDFDRGLVKYFSKGGAVEIKRYIGSTYCSKILKNRTYKAFMILYAWNPDITHYAYHYVFGWRDKNNYIIIYNDGSNCERICTIEGAVADYCLDTIDKQGNRFPQIWGFY